MANGLLDLLGGAIGTTPPAYLEGLLGQNAVEDLRKRSIGSGLVNALVGYAAMPKNQNLGLGRILAGAAQAGMQGAQGVYDTATKDYMQAQKIAEMKRQQEQQLAREAAVGKLPAKQQALYRAYGEAAVPKLVEAAMPKEDSPFAKIDPSKFTPESILKFNATGRYEDLKAAPPDPNSFIQSYEYARSKGYQGTPEDWQKISIVTAQQMQQPYKDTEQQATQAATDYRYKRPQNISVTAGGKVYYFQDQKSADAFKAATRPKQGK